MLPQACLNILLAVNMAKDRPVTVSSTLRENIPTSLATDGQLISNTTLNLLTESCVTTSFEPAPWLAVDLGEETYITNIVIVTGPNCCRKYQGGNHRSASSFVLDRDP